MFQSFTTHCFHSHKTAPHRLGSFTWRTLALQAAFIFSLATANAQAPDLRTWTDSTGRHQVEAKLITRTEKAVTLEKVDGTQVTLLLEKLSQADRDFLQALPATTEPEVDPFAGGQPIEELGGPRPRSRQPNATPGPNTARNANEGTRQPVRELAPPGEPKHKPRAVTFRGASQWNYQPHSSTTPVARSKVHVSWSAPPFPAGLQQIEETLFSANGRVLLVRTKVDDNDVLTVIDLVGGQVIGHEQLPSGNNLNIAISPSGSRIAVSVNQLGQTLEIWTVNGNRLTRDSKSIQTSTQLFFQAKKLIFADESHLFCWGANSCLIDLEQQRVDYEIDIDAHRLESVVTGDGPCLGLFQTDKFHLLRMADGVVVGSLDLGQELRRFMSDSLATAWHGQYLVVFSDRERRLWDLRTGQPKPATPLPPFRNRGGVAHFLTDSLVLQGGEVFHVDLPNPVWTFEFPTHSRLLFDRDRCWLLTNKALIPVELLSPSQKQDIDQTVQLVQNFPFLKRGTRVGLDVDFRHLGNQAEAAKAILLKRLKDIGCVIDPAASLQLRADVRQHATSDWTIERTVNGRIERTSAAIAPLVYDLMLVQNKRVLWRIDQPATPMDNENAQEARERLTTPSTDFFANCELPTKPSPQIKPSPPGVTKIRADGVVE